MATWKKVIVSGSSAALSALTLDTALPVASGGTGAKTAAAARTALGVDAAGTDNSTAVTIAGGSKDFITLSGQALTINQVDLTDDVTGVLPSANMDADTAHLSGTQTFSGDKTFSGTFTANGDASFGDDPTADSITIRSRVASSLVPTVDSQNDLGSTSLYWANAYVDAITTTGNINAGGMISGSFISSSRDIHIKELAVSASIATLSAASGEANESSFKTISVTNDISQAPVVADTDADSLGLTAGAGLAITTDASNDAITFATDGVLEDLDTLGAASADGEFIVATGAGAFAYESGNTARTSLGLGNASAVTFATVNTGQGANELYAMDQNVRTSDSPTFTNLTLSGDLTVEGDTTTLSTSNLTVEDRFVFIATGSAAANVDGGIIVQSGSNADTGSAIYHDKDSQRWAVAKQIKAEATAVTPLSFVTTTTTNATAPGTTSGSYGVGEMWVETDTQDIYIRTA